MKKLFIILAIAALAINATAQDIFLVGYYNANEGTRAALYKNSERLYTANNPNQNSKASSVACTSQGDVFWLVNYYDDSSNTFSHSEIRLEDMMYASTENHGNIYITDLFCLNNTVYYAGYQYNEDSVMVATVWKGSDFTEHWILGDGVHASCINDVDVDKQTSIPYFCGYVIDGKKKASVWVNQELLFSFDQDSINASAEITYSEATQIAVENGCVYTLGKYEVEGAVTSDAIWRDNTLLKYNQPYFSSFHGICAFENTYYYGYSSRDQLYTSVLKSDQSEMLRLNNICKMLSSTTNIYVLGEDFDSHFCVWKNFEELFQIENCDTVYDMVAVHHFIENNAEWYYKLEWDDGTVTYQHLQAESDTTINNERPTVIVRSNTQYDRDEYTEVTHEYVFERNGIVYWWNNELQEFTTLYNLAAETGDEWEIKVGTESIIVHVDSVGVFEYEGETRKVLHISDAGNIFNGDIVVGYGHMTSFFPEKLMNRSARYTVDGLRCYWVEDALLYHQGDEDCDAIYSEIHGVNEGGPTTDSGTLVVYPNPTNGVLTIHHSAFCIPHSAFTISNLMGQTLMTGNISAETQQIDITNLPAGMYFISVDAQTVKFVVK